MSAREKSGWVKLIFALAEVLRAVTHLQVHHAIKLCEDFLIEETTVENCIDVLSLADLFSIPVLEKVSVASLSDVSLSLFSSVSSS